MKKSIKIAGALAGAFLLFGFKKASGLSSLVTNASINAFGTLSSQQKASIQAITNAFNVYGDGDKSKLAYIIATAWHESRLKPVRECFATSDAAARQCIAHMPYGVAINGKVYYGRGFVQLTWLENYQKMANFLNIDLVNNPDLALQTTIAAKILVHGMMNGSFTGKKLSDYINGATGFSDYYNARRIVNGLDQATLIQDYTISLTSYTV